jgi:cytochrome P450
MCCVSRLAVTLLGEDSLLVVKDPQRHAYLRALLQPAFGPDAIASYLPAIEVRRMSQLTLHSQQLGRCGSCKT